MFIKLLLCSALVATAIAQIPSFGGCPKYQPMPEFDKDRFLGKWYESERLFTVTELASKCISATYEKRKDGQIWIDNAITNRFTGVERKITGLMKLSGKSGEATYTVRYNSLPINYDTTLNVLDTDYDSFAVIYSCSSLGAVGHTQSVWVMTRDRFPAGSTLQKAYGVLDKFRITRSFFIQTDQTDCEILPPAEEAYDPTTNKPDSVNVVVNTANLDDAVDAENPTTASNYRNNNRS